ncbi:hypothetical protein T484DRAFT_1892069 [Baffinella frigidus]|nr:hypothetical protein T484DRAFT_1892069 [Cryptophyta sp. CCMP2293]
MRRPSASGEEGGKASSEEDRPETPSHTSGAGTPVSKKKKKKDEGVDAQGRRVLLTDCEIRGEIAIGEKVTAFAKRGAAAKKLPIACTFQWFRIPAASARGAAALKIAGADKASYTIASQDAAHRLRVVGTPVVRETGEEGQPVSAETPKPVEGAASQADAPPPSTEKKKKKSSSSSQPGQPQENTAEPDAGPPCLTDWKIEMNPRQEYTDPIRIHYQYSGGKEGATTIEWFKEIDGKEGIGLADPMTYQATLADVNKRVRILISPVRSDGVTGPTYQHVLEPLIIPHAVKDEVSTALRAVQGKASHQFYLGLVDLAGLDKVPLTKRFLIEGATLKVKHAETDKTELKCKLEPGCLSADVCLDPATRNKVLLLSLLPSRSFPNGKATMAFVANTTSDRDVAILTLRGVTN